MAVQLDPAGNEISALLEMADVRGKDVLEVGCGDGRLTWRYAQETASVLAIDPDAEEIAKARLATPKSTHAHVDFRTANINAIALPARRYDLALFSWSI